MIARWIRRRRARQNVILAARGVEASYEPSLKLKYDPDNLEFLKRAVIALESTERPLGLR